ncbi:MAG TPA: hypothetical protein VNH11_21340 [Pirellulales bacterium]|nr:hypothetical protein [Pirellulales bacterium]
MLQFAAWAVLGGRAAAVERAADPRSAETPSQQGSLGNALRGVPPSVGNALRGVPRPTEGFSLVLPRNATEGVPYTASDVTRADSYPQTAAPMVPSQLWLVSTRSLPHGPPGSSRRAVPEVSRYEQDVWQPSSLDDLMAARDPRLTTVVLVHGNDTDDDQARSKGLGVYPSLVERADQPFRLIIWSWPADYVRGSMRQDVRVKAERADFDAFYLAQFIDELNGSDPVSLVGYSLGARVTTGALHLLGGGPLAGRSMAAERRAGRPPLRAVLMAAAVDEDWLLPGRRQGHALDVVERMVLLVNPRDRVLRWYRFLSPGRGAAALGSRGFTSLATLGALRQKIEQINVNPMIGGQHGWASYASSPEILEQLKREVMIGTVRRKELLGGQVESRR